jgi:hypothetical protein
MLHTTRFCSSDGRVFEFEVAPKGDWLDDNGMLLSAKPVNGGGKIEDGVFETDELELEVIVTFDVNHTSLVGTGGAPLWFPDFGEIRAFRQFLWAAVDNDESGASEKVKEAVKRQIVRATFYTKD